MPSPRALVATPYRRGVIALAVITLVWRAWTISRWTWQDDDWVYLARSASMPLHEYLFQIYNGHLMPAEFLITWIVTEVAPLNFLLPLVLVSVASAITVVLWGSAFAAIAGERCWLLMPLALVSLSPLLLRPTMWWASALQVVPLQVCLAWGVIVAARMAASPSRRHALHLAVVLTTALLFWEKALLLTIPFACVLLSVHGGRVRSRIRTHAWTLTLLAGISVVYLGVYLALGQRSGDQREKGINFSSPPSPHEAFEFVASGLGNLLAPSFLGGPWGSMPIVSDAFREAPGWVAAVSIAGLAIVVASLASWRRGAWFPLVAGAGYVVVSWALVLFSSRFVNLGTVAINDERYSVDCFAVLVLCVVLAGAQPPRQTHARVARMPAGWGIRALGQVLAVSLVVGNVWAVQRVGVAPAKPWVDNVTSEIRAAGPVTVFDSTAPSAILEAGYWLEYAKLSQMLSPMRDLSFTEPAPQLQAVDQSGRFAPITVKTDSRSEPGPVEDCGYSVEPGRTVTVPMSQSLFDWTWAVQVDTIAAEGGELTVNAGDASAVLDIEPGVQKLQAPFSGAASDVVKLTMSGDAGTVCVVDLTIGNAVSATTDAGQ